MTAPRPLGQQSDDSCALACLRMILAMYGIDLAESALRDRASLQPGGVDIQDLANLATSLGLRSTILQLDLTAISKWIEQGVYPIVYLNRALFDKNRPDGKKLLQDAIIHAVIPVRVLRDRVTFNDPLFKNRRAFPVRSSAMLRNPWTTTVWSAFRSNRAMPAAATCSAPIPFQELHVHFLVTSCPAADIS